MTEPCYFRALVHNSEAHRGASFSFIEGAGVPMTVVETALVEKSSLLRENKIWNGKGAGLGDDEVWCVVDRDDHPNIVEAKEIAEREGLKFVLSTPCFELWALLHFEDQSAEIDRRDVARRLRMHIANYEKLLPFERLWPHHQTALNRAVKLIQWQQQQGRDDLANPLTLAHLLTERVLAIASGRPPSTS